MIPNYFKFKVSTGHSKCQWCKKLTKQGQILLQISSSSHVIHTEASHCEGFQEALKELIVIKKTEMYSLAEQEELMEKP